MIDNYRLEGEKCWDYGIVQWALGEGGGGGGSNGKANISQVRGLRGGNYKNYTRAIKGQNEHQADI